MPSLHFTSNSQSHEIILLPEFAPKTIGTLVSSLPARIDIHCAKIAGHHIFWHAPFIADLETGHDIMTLPAGTFLYWPERQFLELIYGDLQAEAAEVTVLGQLNGDIQWLRDLGREVVECHGHRTIWAEVTPGREAETLAVPSLREIPSALQFLRDARIAAWIAEPADIGRLLSRRGTMLPFGPLALAEGELRKLQELLWRLRGGQAMPISGERARVVAFLLQACVDRVDGFCGMTETGAILMRTAALIRENDSLVTSAVDELVLYAGRMAAWLDLHICWNDANEMTLTAQSRREQAP